jgi:hypothetical protein
MTSRDDTPLGALFGDLSRDLRLLATQTAGLATAEARHAASAFGAAMAGLAAGAVMALCGLLVVVAALVLVTIALGLPAWAAASLVGVLLVVAGVGTMQAFLAKLRRVRLHLHETRASVTETIQWLKEQAK